MNTSWASQGFAHLQLNVIVAAGLFSGISMLLLAVFIVMLRASPRVGRLGDVRYMNTVFYVFRYST